MEAAGQRTREAAERERVEAGKAKKAANKAVDEGKSKKREKEVLEVKAEMAKDTPTQAKEMNTDEEPPPPTTKNSKESSPV